MPSFHGGVAWGGWLLMYHTRLIAWDPTALLADILFIVVLVCYAISTAVWYPRYHAWHERHDAEVIDPIAERQQTDETHLYLGFLHAVGLVGWVIYTRAFAAALGGLPAFGQALLGASWMIRRQAEVTSTVGLQLSYFGWMAIALTCYEYRRGRVGRLWLAIAGVQFAANFLYIARTAPITILYTSAVLALAAASFSRTKFLTLKVVGVGAVGAILFILIATWVGKVAVEGQYGATPLPVWSQSLYFYGTGSFAYFSHLVDAQETIAYIPERALYPALKLLAGLGITAPPPSQINEYFSMPFSTNVGTFLEPFYRDGGVLFACAAILVHSFGLDWLGLALLRSGRRLGLFAWANICFVTFISFFTPKLTGFPTWLFTGLAVAAILWYGKSPRLRARPSFRTAVQGR